MTSLPTHCPDCHQPLAEPQRPVGRLGRFSVWCATCEDPHRPRITRRRKAKPCRPKS